MGAKKEFRLGKLKPEYHFSLNPYPDERISKCPSCDSKTGQRKLPLLIGVDPGYMFVLGYTNRYCKKCNRLIGHKHEIEHLLTEMFVQMDRSHIGNRYFIVGTVEKKAWREGMKSGISIDAIKAHLSDFKSYGEIRMTRQGWYPVDVEPPERKPPASTEWVKQHDKVDVE